MFYRTTSPSVEQLESRIAPASVITFTDVDGDTVKIKSSKGVLTGHATFQDGPNGGQQLQVLDLTDDTFAHADITFVVKRGPGGDGSVNVGFINAADNDLGKVQLLGDLGRIVVGDSNAGTPALRLLKVRSMGLLGDSTQGGLITGTLPVLPVVQDLLDQLLGTEGSDTGLLGDITDEVDNLLSQDANLQNLPSDVVRLLTSLQANLQALDLAHDGGLAVDPALLTTLLGNVQHEVHDLGLLPQSSAVLGPLLPNLLQAADTDLNGLLPNLQLPVLDRVDLGHLLDQPLSGLLNIPVLGGLLGGSGGGSTGTTVGTLLTNLGTSVEDLLALNGAGNLSGRTTTLLHQVGEDLDTLLGGQGNLTSGGLVSLADLQTNLAGLLGLANTSPGSLDAGIKTGVETVNHLLETLLGGTGLLGGGADSPLSSLFHGNVNKLRVQSDIKDAFLNIQGNLKSGLIKGSLLGDEAINGGQLLVTGNLGSLLIRRNLVGGDFASSGSVTVNGSVGSIAVNGSLIGDNAAGSGALSFHSDVRSLFVKGNLAGAGGTGSGSVMNTDGDIRHIYIGGSIVSGDGRDSGTLRVSDAVRSLEIHGSIVGDADHRASVALGGLESKSGSLDEALGALSVRGSVRFADIMAGYNTRMEGVNGDAQIGTVQVGKTWQASNLSAGATPVSGSLADPGGANSHVLTGGNSESIVSSIGKVVIRGNVFGTVGGTDQFGFVAEEVRVFNLNHGRLPLSAGAHNDTHTLSQSTGGDVTLREVSTVQPTTPIL